MHSNVEIIPFANELREHFFRINAVWLSKHFHLEPIDLEVLRHPEREIIDAAGVVLFARMGEEIVGTCALKREPNQHFELTKMGVDEAYQGLGIGKLLIDAAIAEFKRLGGKELFLESNRKLATALRLYERSGFEHQAGPKPDSHYSRSDVYMIWREQTS